MKTTIHILAAFGLATTLAACGQKPAGKTTEPAAAAAPTLAATGETMGEGVGQVTAVDAAAGQVTLDHEAIPEVGWPGMVMAFNAAPALLKDVKVGDKVAFEVKVKDGAGELTSLTLR